MKGFAFYAVMPDERKSKSASKAYPFQPWTRATLKRYATDGRYIECLAVSTDREQWFDGKRECVGALMANNDQAVCGSSCSRDYLSERCTRIDEATARKLHPALFNHPAVCTG